LTSAAGQYSLRYRGACTCQVSECSSPEDGRRARARGKRCRGLERIQDKRAPQKTNKRRTGANARAQTANVNLSPGEPNIHRILRLAHFKSGRNAWHTQRSTPSRQDSSFMVKYNPVCRAGITNPIVSFEYIYVEQCSSSLCVSGGDSRKE
jgi:hypothetical protein